MTWSACGATAAGRYGSRKVRAALAREDVTVSRRRVCRIMAENGMASAYARPAFKPHPSKVNESDIPNVLNRQFDGYRPHTHLASDLTYVKVAGKWQYICLPVDLADRSIAGHVVGPVRDAAFVMSAFSTLTFPLSDIEVFHTDRGSEFDNKRIDRMLDVFGIRRSLSAKSTPYDNAVAESTNRLIKKELIYSYHLHHRRTATEGRQPVRVVVQQPETALDPGISKPGRVHQPRKNPHQTVQLSVDNPIMHGY